MNSATVTQCAVCGNADLDPVLNVGYLPPVNTLQKIGERLIEQPFFPAELLHCRQCSLVQLGCVVEPSILFPPEYAYRSSTTKALRDNFEQLVREVVGLGYCKAGDRVLDIGSNDGTLLSFFQQAGLDVMGVEPTGAAKEAMSKGIPTCNETLQDAVDWWNGDVEKFQVITACNVFAHIPDIHGALNCVKEMLAPDGVFVVEVQNQFAFQYDTAYHEHLYYYTSFSLSYLLAKHGFAPINFQWIKTHGGSMRVYYKRAENVEPWLDTSKFVPPNEMAKKSMRQKLELLALLAELKRSGQPIYGIGCPSRAVTLIHYVGLDGVLDCVCEVANSPKVGHYVPGTRIPIVDEAKLYADQPRFALLLSWHLAESLIPKIRAAGFQGQFVIPLPEPRIV